MIEPEHAKWILAACASVITSVVAAIIVLLRTSYKFGRTSAKIESTEKKLAETVRDQAKLPCMVHARQFTELDSKLEKHELDEKTKFDAVQLSIQTLGENIDKRLDRQDSDIRDLLRGRRASQPDLNTSGGED